MLKIQNGSPESLTTVKLSIAGWIGTLVFIASVIFSYANLQNGVVTAKEDISTLKATKLDKTEWINFRNLHDLRDSINTLTINKIAKKLTVDDN